MLSSLVLIAWVGGHAALGAFAARIAFARLDRGDAARTMTQVFHEFDRLILVALGLLAVSAVVGVLARGLGSRSQVRLGLELGLCALGLFEVFHVHASIELMFAAERTLEPAFKVLHRLSERCAHAEILLATALVSLRAWPGTDRGAPAR